MSYKTWSPFQSPQLKEILEHMNAKEIDTTQKRAALYGIWVFITFAMPIGCLVGFGSIFFDSILIVNCIAIGLITIHLIGIPIWKKKQKMFLSNTEWAKTQNIMAKDLKLFSFGGH